MSASDAIVRGTIWLALIALVAAEGGRARARRTRRPTPWALPVFAVGVALCALHFVASFHWHHQWSHTRALEATARQTAEVYGLTWGGGLWVNYVFLAAWLADAILWALHPDRATQRAGGATWALRGFYAVIIVNAAVVFPRGPVRMLGALLVVLLGLFWLRARALAAFSAGAAVVSLFTHRACVDPDIEFLRPSFRGQWIIHPSSRLGADAVFLHRFRLESPAPSLLVCMTAMRELAATINEHPLDGFAKDNWKSPSCFDLGPHLQEGVNLLRVVVANREGPVALLVEGYADVRSGRNWRVSYLDEKTLPVLAGLASRDEVYLQDRWNPFRSSAFYPARQFVLGAFALFLLMGLALQIRRHKATNRAPTVAPASFWHRHAFAIGVIALVSAQHVHNLIAYDAYRSHLDVFGHVEHVRYVAWRWRPMLAEQGWEMFQPPLYYYLAAATYAVAGGENVPASTKAVQSLSTLSALATLWVSWLLLKELLPESARARNLGLVVVALLPMTFYTSPAITNEVFAGGLLGATTLLGVKLLFRSVSSWRRGVLLGIAAGLCLLAKLTGFVVFGALVVLYLTRVLLARAPLREPVVFVSVALALSAWFYVRNYLHYGDPFIGNWDYASGFHYEQTPGYRTLEFYWPGLEFLWRHPEWATFSGFWEGLYATAWADPFRNFVDYGRGPTSYLTSFTLWLALLPTAGILIGLALHLWKLARGPWDSPALLLVLIVVLAGLSAVSFTLEVPFNTTIKAFFFLSLVPVVGVFAGSGLDWLCERLPPVRWWFYAHLTVLAGLILYVFCYRGT